MVYALWCLPKLRFVLEASMPRFGFSTPSATMCLLVLCFSTKAAWPWANAKRRLVMKSRMVHPGMWPGFRECRGDCLSCLDVVELLPDDSPWKTSGQKMA
jgi:hypothetical protein